jgi:protease-4
VSRRVSLVWIFVLVALAGAIGVLLVGQRLGQRGWQAEPNTTLVLELSGFIPEDIPPASRGQFLLDEDRTLWDLVHGIDDAARDPNVSALLVKLEPLDVGWAKLDELRDAFGRFRAAGKPIAVWMAGGGDAEYYLATAAGAIFSAPGALLSVDGLTATSLHLKQGLDELGIRFDVERVGEYKDAPELFTERSPTAPSREAMNSLLDESHSLLLEAICASRGWGVEEAKAALDRGPYRAEDALEAALVDQLLTETDLEDAAEPFGENPMDFDDYLRSRPATRSSRRLALVFATGTVQTGESESDPFSGERTLGVETLAEALEEVRDDERVRAVVLRVDSPGGDTYASRLLYEEVRRTAAVKPVVASFSDVAASGGYYLAMGADTLVAQPGTITGSIGIFGGKFVFEKLMNRLGVAAQVYARGQNAQFESAFRPYTESEREKLVSILLAEYREFVSFVAENRAQGEDEVEALARGRVWGGAQAFVRGLVDTLGGFDAAIGLARHAAGISPDQRVEYEIYPRVKRTLLQRFLTEILDPSQVRWRPLPGPIERALARWTRLPRGPSFAWLPYRIEIR